MLGTVKSDAEVKATAKKIKDRTERFAKEMQEREKKFARSTGEIK